MAIQPKKYDLLKSIPINIVQHTCIAASFKKIISTEVIKTELAFHEAKVKTKYSVAVGEQYLM